MEVEAFPSASKFQSPVAMTECVWLFGGKLGLGSKPVTDRLGVLVL